MVAHDLEQILFEELGYVGSPGLLHGDDIPWANGRKIPDVESALFLKTTPIAYFSRFSDVNPDTIQQLHRNVWSQSKAPLLFVTLPHEIRIYNGYETPPAPGEEFNTPARLLQQLTELSDELTARQKIQQRLTDENHYERIYLETGAFWNTTESKKIKHQTRADKRLVKSLGQMRERLTQMGLSNHVAYTLLGRSIFTRYLEDRGALESAWIRRMTGGQASTYQEALRAGRETTYRLFEQLSHRFNGDLFPIEPAEKEVGDPHLAVLLSFLSGTDLETGQLSLWPYNFEYIPIELISHIYDTFIGDRRASGAYYTPLILADFILEETMGDDVIHPDMTILDPACGSGIFLVGAYRRLIRAWRRAHGEPAPDDLQQLLQNNIFGVDQNREAIRIAAFSLYLEILNHLTNEQIRAESFRFFPLRQRNLLNQDFFNPDVDAHFAGRKFDRVVGNMPWGRGTLTDAAKTWLAENKYVVGGKQAAPAFMLRAPQFCQETGEIALLTPAKSTILVRSEPHEQFREQFFTTYHVRAVVNFAALVYELFPGAISPAVAMFYTPNAPDLDDKLVYGVPKPSPLSQHLQAIVLDTTEIKFLNRTELLAFPELWKIALWGTPRDAALIERFKRLPRLNEQAKKAGWRIVQGVQFGGEYIETWLKQVSLMPTNKLRPYFIDETVFESIERDDFYRPVSKDIIHAPMALIRRSLCQATYSDRDVAYKEKISGILGQKGEETWLKWLVVYINSPLAKYYHFLTSISWGIERKNITQGEYKEMPFLLPNKNGLKLQKVLQHLDDIKVMMDEGNVFFNAENESKINQHERAINELVYELFDLHPVEQQLIEDMIEYGIGVFEWAKRKNRRPEEAAAVKKPSIEALRAYADVFTCTATSLLRVKDRALNATVYQNGAPLTVVSFDLVALDEAQPVQEVTQPQAMRQKLRELDALLLERKTPSMYMRRHVRVFDGNQVSLVRPSERRFWTQSQARADADAFLAELPS